MAITTPDAVPGEVIEAAWGDAVRADLTAIDTTARNAMPKAGGAFTGLISYLAGITPTSPNHITDIEYVQTYAVRNAGDTMAGALSIGAAASGTVPGTTITLGGRLWSSIDTDMLQNFIYTRIGSPAAGTGQYYGQFNRGTTNVGSITVASSTSIAYNTTSDPRAKTEPPATRGISDAAARAQAIGRNAWQGRHLDPDTGETDTGDTWDFVSSHDIEEHAPYAVYGERDAVATQEDVDAGIAATVGQPLFQQVSYGDLVPLLFAGLANALDRLDALEAAAA